VQVMDNVTGTSIESVDLPMEGGNLTLGPGIYDILLSGEVVLDRWITNISIREGTVSVITLVLEEQGFLEVGVALDPGGNFYLAMAYLAISLALFVGSVLVLRSNRWGLLVIIALSGFFTRDPFSLGYVNVVGIFALGALITLIFLRKDMMRSIKVNPGRP